MQSDRIGPDFRSDTYGPVRFGPISDFLNDIARTDSGPIRSDFQIPNSGPVGPVPLGTGRSEGLVRKTKETTGRHAA